MPADTRPGATAIPSHAPRLRALLADNPSPLTFRGTNTYVLGSGHVAVIDPGPADDRHLKAILAALDPGERVSHILITHPHRDHSALAPQLAAVTGATILGFGGAEEGRNPRMAALAAGGMTAGGDGLDRAFMPDRRLADGSHLSGPDWDVTALHTPGHLGGHLCFAAGNILFTGDHVMGWSSTIVAPPDGDMGDYMASLARLDCDDWHSFLPGHGDPIAEPRQRVRALIAHRRSREAQIFAVLEHGPATAAMIATRLYPGLAPALRPAAIRNVLAHLLDLHGKNLATCEGAPTAEGLFSPA